MKPTISDLQPMFYKAMGRTASINESTVKKDMPVWDSISHITLVNEIQDAYKISFKISEIQKIDSVKTLLEIMEKKMEN